MRFIGLNVLVSMALAAMIAPAPSQAATLQAVQLAQATQAALPPAMASQISAAVNSGNANTLADTISSLIAANPSLADEIATFAVLQDTSAARTVAIAAAKAVHAQGGDPTQVTLAVVAALEAEVQPTAGPGGTGTGTGGLTDTQVANLVSQVITGVEGVVQLRQGQLNQAAGTTNVRNTNDLAQYSPPPVNVPPVNVPSASPH